MERFAEHRRDGDAEASSAHRRDEVHDQVRAGCRGSIELIDHQRNRLQEALSDHGLLESTAIVVTSDHGDMMGDHDLYRKSVGYEGSAHVPLLLQLPRRLQEEWGPTGEVDAVVELRDVMPTVLDIAQVPVPPGVDGRSLRDAMALPDDREALRDHLAGEHLIDAWGLQSMQWIRTARHKYIWLSADGHEQLFDLDADPREEHDLLALADRPLEVATALAHHRALLIAHPDGREEGFVRAERAVLVPGGAFRMGSEDPDAHVADGEGPVRSVEVAAFRIDPLCVTVLEYARFVADTGHVTTAEELGWSYVFGGHLPPGVRRSSPRPAGTPWWRGVDEARWDAPEGPGSAVTGRLDRARSPWGDELTPGGEHRCNIFQGVFPVRDTGEDGHRGTAPVGAFAPNGHGLHQVAGNVWERCSTPWGPSGRAVAAATAHGEPTTSRRVIRGGSFLCHDSCCNRYRVAARTSAAPEDTASNMGIRLAVDA